ncbi:MAG TPA: SURF1 family protein [Steroidobacteraceae bacterium]
MPLTLTFRRGRWSASWLMTALTLLAVLAFFQLGRWQWHRAEQKRVLVAAFYAGDRAVQPLAGHSSAALPRYAQVRARGHYDGEHQFLLDNMSHDGRPGYEVLTPLLLEGGGTLMVNRGWVPLTVSRRQLPVIAVDDSVSVSPAGKLDALPVAGIALGHLPPDHGPQWPKLTSFPVMADLSTALARPLEARQLLLNPDEPYGYLRDWKPNTSFGPEGHISYAVQWWGFALLALGLYGFLNWQRAKP